MNHTLKAALDLLYELQRCKIEERKINDSIYRLNQGDNFAARISATIGYIESRIVDMLDLYFEEITGDKVLATHILYETGQIYTDDKRYDCTQRVQFEKYLAEREKRNGS